MAFTVAHAAAALPFRKLKPIWPALVIGTFAPDFEYFLRLTDEDRTGHHLPGLFTFTFPTALLAFWLFECYVKQPLWELLPLGVQRRLLLDRDSAPFSGRKKLGLVVLWMSVGMATHIIWDWFTHPNTWIWEQWAWLRQPVAVPFHRPVVMSKLLQHATTLLGLGILAAWFALWYYRAKPMPSTTVNQLCIARKVILLLTITGVAIAAGYPLAAARLWYLDPAMNHIALRSTVVEAVILLWCAQILLYGVARTHYLQSRLKSITRIDEREKPEKLAAACGKDSSH